MGVFCARREIMNEDPLFWLGTDNYRIYNVEMAKAFKSINAAVFLSELANRYRYHLKENQVLNTEKHGDGWFYFTSEKCEERTALSRREQDTAITILENLGLIEKKIIGVPSKRHFRLNIENINKFFKKQENPDCQARLAESAKLEESAKLGWRKAPSCVGGNGQAGTIYIKEQKKEKKKEESTPSAKASASPPSPAPTFPKKIERAPHVQTSEADHQKLIDKYGAEKTAQFYEHLSLWKQTKPENKLKSLINGDYARINKWVVASVKKAEIEQQTLNLKELQNKQIADRLSQSKPNQRNLMEEALKKDPQQKQILSKAMYDRKVARGEDVSMFEVEGVKNEAN